MKVSFVLLAHEGPEKLKDLIQSLLAAGSNVYMHHDASSAGDMRTASADWGLDLLPGKLYLADRIKVVWGEWSIIEATLNCMKLIREYDTDSDYFMLISGSCMPVKPVAFLQEYLAKSGKDHIEAVNAEKNQWVTAGLQKQRWSKYHLFNWRYQPFLFDTSLNIQRKLKIKRVIPLKHAAHMGSQWWCLRRSTLMAVLDLIDQKAVLRKFYKRTWVPDELFFQTLVANLIPKTEISGELMTRYTFNFWGIPRVYYDDDYPELLAESRFFVRKVSHRAQSLRELLASIAPMSIDQFSELLKQSEAERTELVERLRLLQHIEANRWHSLGSHQVHPDDYIKSIPNRMVVLVGEDTQAKFEALAQLDRLNDTVVYGDLFDPKEVGKGYEHAGYLGISRDAVKLAKHTWYQVLGDIAYQSPGKTLVFSLGNNFKYYLEVLQWKDNLNVLLIDGHKLQGLDKETMKELYLKSQVLHLIRDRHYSLTRVNLVQLKGWVDQVALMNKHSIEYVRWHVEQHNEKPQWASLLLDSHDHWDFLKQLKTNIVVLISDTRSGVLPIAIKRSLEEKANLKVQEGLFDVISAKDHTLDWHYYLADVAELNRNVNKQNLLVIALGRDQLARLDTLKWKKNLMMVHLRGAGRDLNVEPEYTLAGGWQHFHHADSSNAKMKLNTLLADRYCSYYEVSAQDHDFLAEMISHYGHEASKLVAKKQTLEVN